MTPKNLIIIVLIICSCILPAYKTVSKKCTMIKQTGTESCAVDERKDLKSAINLHEDIEVHPLHLMDIVL